MLFKQIRSFAYKMNNKTKSILFVTKIIIKQNLSSSFLKKNRKEKKQDLVLFIENKNEITGIFSFT